MATFWNKSSILFQKDFLRDKILDCFHGKCSIKYTENKYNHLHSSALTNAHKALLNFCNFLLTFILKGSQLTSVDHPVGNSKQIESEAL